MLAVLDRNRRIVVATAIGGTAVTAVSSSRQVRRSIQFQVGLLYILKAYLPIFFLDRSQKIEAIHEKTGLELEALVRRMRGAYVKSAQLVATAFPEVLPDAWVTRLETLVDDAPARPWSETQKVLENELGADVLNASFRYINPEPIAAASIGQVHQAFLRSDLRKNEDRVAVKIMYPGVERLILSDLGNIRRVIQVLKPALLPAIDEFRSRVRGEFDFIAEARRADAIADFFEGRPDLRTKVVAPRSIPSLTTKRVLVMDWLDGKSLRDSLRQEYAEATKTFGLLKNYRLYRLRRRARKVLETVAAAHGAMIFDHGGFTIDSHPGNLLDCRRSLNGKIGIIDFGSFQTYTPHQRAKLATLYAALDKRDKPAIVNAMTALGFRSKNSHPDFVTAFATQCFDRDIVTSSPYQLLASMERQDKLIVIPSSYMLTARVSLLMRGLARRLGYSDFSCSELWRDEFLRCLPPSSNAN